MTTTFDQPEVEYRPIKGRKLTRETCELWGYGFGTFKGQEVHVAQFFNHKDKAHCGSKLRFPTKDFLILGSLEPAGLYGRHLWGSGGKAVVVTEGELDALSMSQAQGNKWPVVSIPNGIGKTAKGSAAEKAIKANLDWLETFERVVLMFDMDEPGQAAAVECAQLFSPNKCCIASLPLKDASEMVKADRGEELIRAFWNARPYRPDGIIAGEELWEKLTEEDHTARHPWPHAGLNAKTYGMGECEVITITAGTGIGKSTWCRETAFSLMKSTGVQVGYIALEENARRTALGFCSIALDKPLHLDTTVDPVELRGAFDSFQSHLFVYDHFGSVASGNLISRIRFLFKGCGCKVVFLDHITMAVADSEEAEDERRTLDRLMTRLASLANEAHGTIVIVCHLSRSEGKPFEEGKQITLQSLRGSHGIAQNSAQVIALERDQQAETDEERDTCVVRVLKCRHSGMTGEAGKLRYHRETGRLLEEKPNFDFEGGTPNG